MEKVAVAKSRSSTQTVINVTRYGNVMASRGSVIPLFLKQILSNQDITITDPNMTRFLMTLDQSVDLVCHAMRHSQGGEIFVRKAPACTVQALAETMRIKYSPRGEEHPIKTTGIRPGEKIHEVLVNEYEMQRITEENDYFTIHPEYRLPTNTSFTEFGTEYTSANTHQLTEHSDIGKLLDRMGEVEFYI